MDLSRDHVPVLFLMENGIGAEKFKKRRAYKKKR